MRGIHLFAAAAALLATVQAASAQAGPLALELRGGYAIPTERWNDQETLDNGSGYGAHLMAMVTPRVGVYAGWETYSFPVNGSTEGFDTDATDEGYRAGVSISATVPRYRNVAPFIEAGLLYNSLEIGVSRNGTTVQVESDRTVGFEAGVGFATEINERVSIVPVLRYRQHEAEFDTFTANDSVRYIVAALGLRFGM